MTSTKLFKSTKLTKQLAQVIAVIYGAYALFALPVATLLLSLAAGLIVLGIFDSVEIAITATIVVGIAFKFILSLPGKLFKRREPFQTLDSKQVAATLAGMRKAAPKGSPMSTAAMAQGTLASSYAEGFADAGTTDGGAATAGGTVAKAPEAAATKPAPTKSASDMMEGMAEKSDGLFTLGKLPSETKTGPHIDTGSTLLTALQKLDTNQIKSMTDDTRKLLDTQKTLMNMLQSMKPMLTDGKELLSTFNNMFGQK